MKRLLAALTVGICGLMIGTVQAQPTAVPPNILAANNLPMVMLSASKDFTMFWKAYTDFDDIDLDGTVDRTFAPNFRYYGYFDPLKCYTYDSGESRFEPSRLADKVDKTVVNGVDRFKYYCTAGAGEWSGNFLNWVTMSRIDVLRKVLYGGMRSTDTADDTTLELSFVPRNSQAIVKYYNGDDLDRLTAFNSNDAKNKGLTFCRRPQENEGVSHVIDSIPEIRVAVGNVILWNMTEVRTCNWSSEIYYKWKPETRTYLEANYVTPKGTLATGDHKHLESVPEKSGENTSYVARVQACKYPLQESKSC
ncbi:MAG TPA: hypothetical protein VMN83_12090, partial [Albitalea sp.]|nr:hypothetical protein [Albitalea sp.]